MDDGGSTVRRRVGAVWRWLAGHQFVAALILIGGVVAGALVRDQVLAARDREFVQCVADWGDRVSARSTALTTAGNERADKLDALLRTVAEQMDTGRADRVRFRRQLGEYVVASDSYQQRLRENPVPEPPRIRC